MQLLTEKRIQDLLAIEKAPCLSLYMPTYRNHPDNRQDPIRFKNLLKEMEQSLIQKYSSEETNTYLAPLEKFSEDDEFWNNSMDGLALFSAPDFMEVIKLPIAVESLAIVADSFHTKPLRNYLQSTDRYHLLGLSLDEFTLYEGNRHSLQQIKLSDDIPNTMEDALGKELTDEHHTVASYGGAAGESNAMHHGHGGKKDQVDLDAERFFRVVSKEVEENFSKPLGLPLILAALPEHHHLFQKVNKNSALLQEGIQVNPSSVPKEKLAKMAWEVMEPAYKNNLKNYVDQYEEAKAAGKGTDDYKELAVAAVEGRIASLIVEADRIIAARITNLVTGNTQKKDMDNPRVDDLLDDMSELVLKMGGKVVVMPPENMPTDTGLAGILRY
ncbi:hypothetical protein [Cyclobacterium jeungdonense]|uniref:Uncharacterized protein n=1 Tax=Cyclobacterium jeungdonense TaxID=708087 RepID=A0ABT8C5L9_9BACT|nr:hypothetical protein [Cyclobacterium jeungdonense]MDN3687662.1 hypothetical protein [Cyclobacterium jeungdonense]